MDRGKVGKHGKYKPFVSYMEFDRTFEGEIE